MKDLSCDQLESIGQSVVDWFNLKEAFNDSVPYETHYNPKRYETNHGNKTLLGLGAVVLGIVQNQYNKENK